MVPRTLGIDLSSDPKSTAGCLVEWRPRALQIVELAPAELGGALEIEHLVALVRRANKAGIDSPFGWPEPFVRAITEWENKGEWTGEDRSPLRYRTTDLKVRGKPRMPLSVSTERLRATAMRCALLLSQLTGVNRAGTSGPVTELWPAAALHHWGLHSTGYKDSTSNALELRREIVAGLRREFRTAWRPPKAHLARLEAEHDLLDSFIAALVARAVQLRRASRARTAEERRLADFEGWIRLPECSLRELLPA